MRLEYDPHSGDFIRLGGQGLQAIRRFHLESSAFTSPTVEDAFEALAILQSLRRSAPATSPSRPSPAPRKRTEQELLDDYVAKGGHITISTHNPVPKPSATRLREAKAEPTLNDLLGDMSPNELKALLAKLSAKVTT